VEALGRVKSKEHFPSVFSRHALAYQQRLERIMSRGESAGRLRALEMLDAGPGMKILDLACGPGTLSRRLVAAVSPGGEVTGVDLAPGMIELANTLNLPSARFELMDIEHLAFDDAAFDGAICGHGLQFVSDLPGALREARRVLRPRGKLCASVPIGSYGEAVWIHLYAVIDRWVPPAPETVDQASTRATVQDAEALRQAAVDAGFESAAVELIEEEVPWASAEQLVKGFMGWVDCAARIEGMDEIRRQAIMDDAIETLSKDHPGRIVTKGRNHVLLAVA
jgi:ubiquinone/menaquinone biosynthesis C-methylase UbiE